MKIGIDIDGVLADFTKSFNALVRAEFGIELPYPAPTWQWHREGGVTKQQDNQLWNIIKTTHFWATLVPLPGAIEVIQRLDQLSHDGHDVYFITSRPGKLAKFHTEWWLKSYGMNFPTVLVTSDKGPVVQGLGLNIFIDDKPENNAEVIAAVAQASSGKLPSVYLLDAPYNQWAQDAYGIRIATVQEVLDLHFTWREAA